MYPQAAPPGPHRLEFSVLPDGSLLLFTFRLVSECF